MSKASEPAPEAALALVEVGLAGDDVGALDAGEDAVAARLALLGALAEAGTPAIEAARLGAGDAGSAAAGALLRLEEDGLAAEGVAYAAETADAEGLAIAVAAGVTEITVAVSAAEVSSLTRYGVDVAARQAALEPLIEEARSRFLRVRALVLDALDADPRQAAAVAEGCMRLGAVELAFAAPAEPGALSALWMAVGARAPLSSAGLRLTTLRASSDEAVRAALADALAHGVRTFDGSIFGRRLVATPRLAAMLEALAPGAAPALDLAALTATAAAVAPRARQRDGEA